MPQVRTVARDRRDLLGEGPLWSARENAVYWTDILGRRVNRLLLADGRVDSWELPDFAGWVIERQQGGLVAGVGRAFVRLDLDGGVIETIAEPEPDREGNRINDAKADPNGRIWAGTMPIGADKTSGALYRLDPDGATKRVDDGYYVANGPAISADGRMLLHTDSARGTIFRFAIRDDGRLEADGVFMQFEKEWGSPDGMTFDADGCLWVACWGGARVMRFTPKGRHERSIALPASRITSCTFAGPELDRMFVTSASIGTDEPEAGRLFEVDPGCRGLPTRLYRG